MTVLSKSHQRKEQQKGRNSGVGVKLASYWRLIPGLSRGKNELIGEFKMAAGDVISITG